MDKSLIIAHYNEDLNWLYDIDKNIKIFLYTKSDTIPDIKGDNIIIEQLENIGNEGQTYLYHIVKYYDSLTDYLCFTQAKFDEHSHDFLVKLNNGFIGGLSDINLITTVYGPVDNNLYHKHINHKYTNGFDYQNVENKIFIDPWNDNEALENINFVLDNLPELNFKKENWIFNANGLYGVSKDKIKNFNIDFYKKCEKLFREKPENLKMIAFAFERIFQLILL
jgi:hypothetical protein